MRTPEFEFFALHADADNKHWSTERDSMSFSEKKGQTTKYHHSHGAKVDFLLIPHSKLADDCEEGEGE